MQRIVPAFSDQNLRRIDTCELGCQLCRGNARRAQLARREREPRHADRSVAACRRRQRQQRCVRFVIQQRCVGQRSRRDDAHDLALDRSLAGGGIADLLADRNAFTELDQLAEVLLDRHHRHAGHLDRCPGRVTACGQSQVKQPRAALRIVVKQLVKIAHPIEQQGVRMLGLDAPVLLHHRCVRRDVDSGVHARTAIDPAIVRARDARRRPASTVAERSSAMRTRCGRLP